MAATLEQQIEGEAQRLYQQRAFSEPTTQAWKDWADLTDEEREPYRRTARNLLTGSPDPVDTRALAADAEEHGREQMKGGIRVLRVVEYVYPTVKAMADDMTRWAVQRNVTYGKTHIRSVTLPPEVLG
jgi:hypothetical protein